MGITVSFMVTNPYKECLIHDTKPFSDYGFNFMEKLLRLYPKLRKLPLNKIIINNGPDTSVCHRVDIPITSFATLKRITPLATINHVDVLVPDGFLTKYFTEFDVSFGYKYKVLSWSIPVFLKQAQVTPHLNVDKLLDDWIDADCPIQWGFIKDKDEPSSRGLFKHCIFLDGNPATYKAQSFSYQRTLCGVLQELRVRRKRKFSTNATNSDICSKIHAIFSLPCDADALESLFRTISYEIEDIEAVKVIIQEFFKELQQERDTEIVNLIKRVCSIFMEACESYYAEINAENE